MLHVVVRSLYSIAPTCVSILVEEGRADCVRSSFLNYMYVRACILCLVSLPLCVLGCFLVYDYRLKGVYVSDI